MKATTKLACGIANVDPLRFNEFVHWRKYPCAPLTQPGTARVFEVEDIIALRFFRLLTDLSLSAENAGFMACELLMYMRQEPGLTHATFLRSNSGVGHVMPGLVEPDKRYGGFHDKALWMTFSIEDMRAYVVHKLEEARSIIGEE